MNFSNGRMEIRMENARNRLLQLIKESVTPFHAAEAISKRLEKAGFTELGYGDAWELQRGKGYYLKPFQTTVIAFRVNENWEEKKDVRISAAHTDSPCLRIKCGRDIIEEGYLKVNTEPYGGGIWNTWLDRPLSAAGSVVLKGSSPFYPKTELINFESPVFVIPNMAFHMNRKVNEGMAINPQIDLLPLAGSRTTGDAFFFRQAIAKKLGVDSGEILSYDIYVYNHEEGKTSGLWQDMITAPRLDNLTSVSACIQGITGEGRKTGLDAAVFFDHEEIGSNTKNGANGNLLEQVLERIFYAMGSSRSEYLEGTYQGFFLSLDVAHALHPNHREKGDLTTMMNINDGIAIKCAAKQSYSTDSEMAGILTALAKEADIPCRMNYARSDAPVGSTVGPMVTAKLVMRGADIGIPVLAMHSAMETAGAKDQFYLEKLLQRFYTRE